MEFFVWLPEYGAVDVVVDVAFTQNMDVPIHYQTILLSFSCIIFKFKHVFKNIIHSKTDLSRLFYKETTGKRPCT